MLADQQHRALATDALDPDAVAIRFAEDFRPGQHQRRHSLSLNKFLMKKRILQVSITVKRRLKISFHDSG
jgi:hypothetical protein